MERYRKHFSLNDKDIELLISTFEKNDDIENINFEVGFGDTNISEFTFIKETKELDGKREDVWDLNHRLAKMKDFDISGSEIYTWIEKYIETLFENEKLNNLPLYAEVFQPNVKNWFLKNKYELENKSKILLDEIEKGNEYETIPVEFHGYDYQKDDFWIKKDFINEDKLKGYNIKIIEKEGQKMLVFKEGVNPENIGLPVLKFTKKL